MVGQDTVEAALRGIIGHRCQLIQPRLLVVLLDRRSPMCT